MCDKYRRHNIFRILSEESLKPILFLFLSCNVGVIAVFNEQKKIVLSIKNHTIKIEEMFKEGML